MSNTRQFECTYSFDVIFSCTVNIPAGGLKIHTNQVLIRHFQYADWLFCWKSIWYARLIDEFAMDI